ncbi:MAG: SIMPL domain-containing protein [Planctomycetota bacterium]
MKKGRIIGLIIVLVLSVGFLAFAIGIGFQRKAYIDNRITSEGIGEVKVAPDEVVVYLGIVKKDRDVTVATGACDEIVAKIMQLADKYNVDKSLFKTDFLKIRQEYIEENHATATDGYVVTKNIVITVKDAEKFDKIFSEAVAAGVTHIHDVQFIVSNLENVRERAKDAALAEARRKAEWHARQLGKKVTGVETLSEESSRVWSWYDKRAEWDSARDFVALKTSNMEIAAYADSSQTRNGESGPRYEFGQVTVVAKVNATFEIGE